jgi:hypothetical protein
MGITVPGGLDWWLHARIEGLTPEQKAALLEMLKQDQEESRIETERATFWNKDAILKNIKENYVKIEEATFAQLEWKKFHINLPANWHFNWFKFDCFVSKGYVKKDDLTFRPYLRNLSYSYEEIFKYWGLIDAIMQYMKELWVTVGIGEASKYFKDITGLNNRYLFKEHGQYKFGEAEYSPETNRAKYLLKASD